MTIGGLGAADETTDGFETGIVATTEGFETGIVATTEGFETGIVATTEGLTVSIGTGVATTTIDGTDTCAATSTSIGAVKVAGLENFVRLVPFFPVSTRQISGMSHSKIGSFRFLIVTPVCSSIISSAQCFNIVVLKNKFRND